MAERPLSEEIQQCQGYILTPSREWMMQKAQALEAENARLRKVYEAAEAYLNQILETAEGLVLVNALADVRRADRRPGRPEVGPAVMIRLPPELLARVDREAERAGERRAATVRRLLERALEEK